MGTTLLSCFVIWLKSAFNKMIVGLFLVARLADHYHPQNVLINDVFDRVCVCVSDVKWTSDLSLCCLLWV